MSLQELSLKKILDTSRDDLIADFFIPALSTSIRYDRGVGFFSAAWLRIAAKGIVEFARNSGRARWVTSPILSEGDWLALQQGEAARHDVVLRRVIERNIADLEQTLEHETLSALAWLVADGILNFKLALPRNKLAGGGSSTTNSEFLPTVSIIRLVSTVRTMRVSRERATTNQSKSFVHGMRPLHHLLRRTFSDLRGYGITSTKTYRSSTCLKQHGHKL